MLTVTVSGGVTFIPHLHFSVITDKMSLPCPGKSSMKWNYCRLFLIKNEQMKQLSGQKSSLLISNEIL